MNKSDLSLGMMDDEVGTLHTRLQETGLYIPEDEAAKSYFGPGTHQAVVLFQAGRSLPVTGVCDQQTATALGLIIIARPDAVTLVVPSEPEPHTGCCGAEIPGATAPAFDPRSEDAGGNDMGASSTARPVNKTCPWSGKPVSQDALWTHKDRLVGFCSATHRDKFKAALEHFEKQKTLALEARTCPWSGRPVQKNATMVYENQVIGFCSPAHRDQFKAAIDHFSSAAMQEMPDSMSDSMAPMEEVEDTIFVPPLVDERVLAQFCQAVQGYADANGLHEPAAAKLRDLRTRLANLCNLASLCRFAISGAPHAFARVIDEMHCLCADFPREPIEEPGCHGEFFGDNPDPRTDLTAAMDLFTGAAFVSKDDPAQRDRFIIGIVRAIENAIAFPITFSAEAAAYLADGTPGISPAQAALVIANATQRLIGSDEKCVPLAPIDIRIRLERLACKWMRINPVTLFFDTISGPRVHRIVRWQDSSREQPDCARAGDPVTLLFRPGGEAESGECGCERQLRELGVMFSPHQPGEVLGAFENGLQVRIPEDVYTGPVAIIRNNPDFSKVTDLLVEYAREYPGELFTSILGVLRMAAWAYPIAFGPPILRITRAPTSATVTAFIKAGPLSKGHRVAVNDTVAVHYSVDPPGSDGGVPPVVQASGGVVTLSGKPGVLFFRPSNPGATQVVLAWGSLQVTIPISVDGSAGTGGGTQ